MRYSKVRLNFKRYAGIKLEDFAEGINLGIFGHLLIFLLTPITAIAFQALITEFSNARKAYEQGGSANLPLYNKTMKALKAGLLELAPYVDTIALGDIATIKMAGFEATFDPANAKGGPIVEEGLTLLRPVKGTGILISECSTYVSGTTFVGLLFEGNTIPAGITVVDSKFIKLPKGSTVDIILGATRQNKKIWTGLTPGVNYGCCYVVINSAGISSFSNVSTMMCG